MDLGHVGFGGIGQRPQRLQPAGDVFERHGLQFGAALQGLHEQGERRLNRFTALREPIKKACAVEIAQAGNPRSIGLRFKVAPGCKLGECCADVFDAGRSVRPAGFGKHLVGAELQAILSLGRGEDIHDATIERRFLGTHMPEQLG